MSHPPSARHHYLSVIEVMLETGELRHGDVVRVEHDGWCAFQHGRGYCNCAPVVSVARAEDADGLAGLPTMGSVN